MNNDENLNPPEYEKTENTCAYCDKSCKNYTCGSRECLKAEYYDNLDD